MQHSHIRINLTAFLFVAVFCFWYLVHPEALSFREQYQMFLFEGQYLAEHLSVAGGVAAYVSGFIIQFFYYPLLGAAFLAMLFALFQLGQWSVARQMSGVASHRGLSFVAPLLTLCYMEDENVQLTFLTALTICTWAAVAYGKIERGRTAAKIIGTPILYWICGPAFIVYLLLCAAIDLRRRAKAADLWPLAYGVAVVFISAYTLMRQCDMPDVLWGQNYHNLRMTWPPMQFVIEGLCVALPVVMSFLPSIKRASIIVTEGIAVCAAGMAVAFLAFDTEKYGVIELESLVRSEKWDAVAERGLEINSADLTALSAVNLALEQKGTLLSEMFAYPQRGVGGLITLSLRNQFSSLPSAEALFRMGMVNLSQQYFFDLQEGIVNCQKSGRLSKRIAETLIVNGRYEMARKYLYRLRKTLFYSAWARKAETFLGNEHAVNSHPTWGKLRRLRHKMTFYFNYAEMDKMLGLLYADNNANRMALDYFVAQALLRRDLKQLWQSLAWVRDAYGDNMPRHVQEAAAMAWTQSHSSFEGMPIKLSVDVMHDMTEFAHLYTSNPNDPRLDSDRWRKTFWHYMLRGVRPDGNTGATQTAESEQVK